MTRTTVANRANLTLIEDYFERWRADPESVDPSWRHFFEGYELGQSRLSAAPATRDGPAPAQAAVKAVTRLVDAYRELGHFLADLDPLKLVPRPQTHEELELSAFGLAETDLDQDFYSKLGTDRHCTLRELLGIIRQTYCRTIGVEFMHIQDLTVRQWLLDRMEPVRNRPGFDLKKKRRIIFKLNAAELFENFLHKNYVGQKRFSLEGGEMLIPLLDAVIERRVDSACSRSSWAWPTAAGSMSWRTSCTSRMGRSSASSRGTCPRRSPATATSSITWAFRPTT